LFFPAFSAFETLCGDWESEDDEERPVAGEIFVSSLDEE
jgi:hypothetical protein